MIPGFSSIRRAARRFRSLIAPGAVILLYHRVAEVDSDPWSLCVTPQHFAEHLEVLRQECHPLRLDVIGDAVRATNRPERLVTITLDDGYADNLHNAKFHLERYDVPATVFVVSGYVGAVREFWWDELERLFLQPGTLPDLLCLDLDGQTFRWHLGESAHYTEEDYQRHRSWHIADDDPTPRHSVYRSLWKLLNSMPEDQRCSVLEQLLTWSSLKPVSRSVHLPLSVAELLALNSGGVIEVGAHSVTHPHLSALPAVAQRHEIQQSKLCLEEMLGCPVRSFAYPHGDYTKDTVRMVREAGFARACSTIADSVRGSADPFRLPRIEVHDCDGEEFARRLSPWFSG